MTIELKNKKTVLVRQLVQDDTGMLFLYFSGLSAETRSRFAPHPFDRETAAYICNNPGGDIHYYVAVDETGSIVAYMLVKKRMIEEDRSRLLSKNIYYDQAITCSFAPSVADEWQNCGLGSAMYDVIEKDILENTIWRVIVLWGGVQATNARAVHFYEKKGFEYLGEFYNDGKSNFDMCKIFNQER
jgi:diamine N-acetyltransferase